MSKNEYDGFYFVPGEEDDTLNISYFKFNEKKFKGKPVDNTPIGDKYHIAFFTFDDEGNPQYDEDFEAIFADPAVYVRSLAGSNLFGCILRKTDKSGKWWKNYLTTAKDACKMVASNE